MGFQFIQVVVVRQEFFKVFRATECVQIDEYRVAFHFSGILHTDVVRISEHGHDLGSDIFRFVGQVDAVAKGFAHFCLTVDTRQTQAGLVAWQDDLWLSQGLAVYAVELVYDFFTLFDHRHLVFTYRYTCGTESGDVSGLADRITEESNRDAGFEVSHLDLSFYSRVTLYTGYGNQIHIVESQLSQFRDHGLNENRGFLRVQTTGKIIECYLHDVLTNFLRVFCVIGQCLRIGDHNIDFVIVAGVL